MRIKDFYKELIELASTLGYRICRDNGNFRGGACILNNEKIIVLNRNLPIELQANILSNAIYHEIQSKFIKPELRKRIEKEVENGLITPIQIIVIKEENEKR